jgi:hypothetical protein
VIDLSASVEHLGGSKMYVYVTIFMFFSATAHLLQREQKGSFGNARPCGEEGRQTLGRTFTQWSLFPGAFPDFTDDVNIIKEDCKAVQYVKDDKNVLK